MIGDSNKRTPLYTVRHANETEGSLGRRSSEALSFAWTAVHDVQCECILALLLRVPALIGSGEECVHSVGCMVRYSNLQLPPLWLERVAEKISE